MTQTRPIAVAVTQDALESVLNRLAGMGSLYAPARTADGRTFTAKVSSGWRLEGSLSPGPAGAKERFLPRTETLLRFSGRPPHSEITDALCPETLSGATLFGLRPCEGRALSLVDRIFLEDPKDPYYAARRQNLTAVAVACNEADVLSECFCTAVGGHPHGTDGLDVLLIRLEGKWLARPLTEKGLAWTEPLGGTEGSYEDTRRAAELGQTASKRIDRNLPVLPQDTVGRLEKALTAVDPAVWEELSGTCLNCGVCSFMCPCCHCFDIVDETSPTGGRRVRVWDTCQSVLFTQEASGHNPRHRPCARMRQRFLHKFAYLTDCRAMAGCVGCGICIRNCPVGGDIRENILHLLEKTRGDQA